MLLRERLEHFLSGFPGLTVAVVGDLFLDRYLEIDAALTEPSLETGLDAYQVAAVRASPGAAGTVINNLAALGVGRIVPVAAIGDDGEGYELIQALDRLPSVDRKWLIQDGRRRTPTYTKPMLHQAGQPSRELNRLDIKNRIPLPVDLETRLLKELAEVWQAVDAVLIVDQVSETDCGVITGGMRKLLQELGERDAQKFVLADSRERVGLFRGVCVKPNQRECLGAVEEAETAGADIQAVAVALSRRTRRAVFCTVGAAGILLVEPADGTEKIHHIPAYPVSGPIDIVGAGDSTSAAIAAAVAGGANFAEGAAFGNLVASITIQQLGTTGTASPEQVRQRWRELVPSEPEA